MQIMRNERRYTEGQKNLLALDQSKLDDGERELLRRVLLPRTKYLPASEGEATELALQMLKREKYEAMQAMIGEIRARYGAIECRWTRGNHMWDLIYSVKKNGNVLCRFGITLDVFNLILFFGKEDCERFERERDSFPRAEIQWTFDMAYSDNGRKVLNFSTRDPSVWPHLFRLLAYKKMPADPRG